MNEPYSRSLSVAARAALVDFLEAYLESLKTIVADNLAEIAKQKAQVVLNTDIDILIFVSVSAMLYTPSVVPLVTLTTSGKIQCRELAESLVTIFEQARRIDIQGKTN